MGVLDGSGDRKRVRGWFGGEFGASCYNQWRLCCIVVDCGEDLLFVCCRAYQTLIKHFMMYLQL